MMMMEMESLLESCPGGERVERYGVQCRKVRRTRTRTRTAVPLSMLVGSLFLLGPVSLFNVVAVAVAAEVSVYQRRGQICDY